jgi:hypothetical protein
MDDDVDGGEKTQLNDDKDNADEGEKTYNIDGDTIDEYYRKLDPLGIYLPTLARI